MTPKTALTPRLANNIQKCTIQVTQRLTPHIALENNGRTAHTVQVASICNGPSESIWDHFVWYRLAVLCPVLAVLGVATHVISERSVSQKKGQKQDVKVG